MGCCCNCDQLQPTATADNCNRDQLQLGPTATGTNCNSTNNCNCNWDQLQLRPTTTATNCNCDQLQLRSTASGPTATGPTATATNCNCNQLQPANCNCNFNGKIGNQVRLQHRRALILSGGVHLALGNDQTKPTLQTESWGHSGPLERVTNQSWNCPMFPDADDWASRFTASRAAPQPSKRCRSFCPLALKSTKMTALWLLDPSRSIAPHGP